VALSLDGVMSKAFAIVFAEAEGSEFDFDAWEYKKQTS
jgi:hypothetical protein